MVKIKKEWLWITDPGTVGEAYQKGLKDGRIKARQEARQEGQQQMSYEIAAKMIADGMTTQKISDFTGLSIAQIDALRQIQEIIRRFFLSDSIFFNLARQKFGLSTEKNDAL